MKNPKNFLRLIAVSTASIALLAMVAWISPNKMFQVASENDFIRSIKQKLSNYNEKMPSERLYVQFDKPFYEPGETIWLLAFIREGESLKASGKSDIVHVEFINPKGTVEKTINLIAKKGIAAGDFHRSR